MRSAFWSAKSEALPQRRAMWSAENEALPQRKALWSAESEAKKHGKISILPTFLLAKIILIAIDHIDYRFSSIGHAGI